MRPYAALLCPIALVAAAPNWEGDYALDLDRSDPIPAAIQKLTDPMNFLLKTFWKKKLEKSEKPAQALNILKGGNLTITQDKDIPFSLSAGNPTTWKRSDGESFTIDLIQDGPDFTLIFKQDEVAREQRYSLASDGKTLTVGVTYRHPKLPEPLKYQLVYKKSA